MLNKVFKCIRCCDEINLSSLWRNVITSGELASQLTVKHPFHISFVFYEPDKNVQQQNLKIILTKNNSFPSENSKLKNYY